MSTGTILDGRGNSEPLAAARARLADAPDRGAVLAIAFGTTVAMWAVGYVTHLPPAVTPSWAVALAMLALMAGGGFVAGRWWRAGWGGGLRVGLVSALLNMLILGSLLSSKESPNSVVPSALLWLPGALLLGAALGAAGAAWGTAVRPAGGVRAVNWTCAFTLVTAGATLLLLAVGGLVTSQGAGLAVVDWPNSFGYNMFLYPLSRMTGGVYYEHAHRLFGSLVGLTTLVLAVHLALTDDRRWMKRLGFGALAFVIVQGLLGGLRVTGRFTMSASPADTAPSTPLAIVHGVTGQLFFALLVAMAAFTTTRWKRHAGPVASPSAGADRTIAPTLVGVLVVQLILGAILRHAGAGLVVHISAAALVWTFAMLAGVRAWGLTDRPPEVKKLGLWLMGVVSLQVLLGIGAVAAVGATPGKESAGVLRAVLATPHQVTGAILLGVAVALALWTQKSLVACSAEIVDEPH